MADEKDWSEIVNRRLQDLATLGINSEIHQESGRSGLPGGRNGAGDAYRHVLRSAELHRELPDAYASLFNNARELASTTNPRMDHHNNAVGKAIGQYAQEHGLNAEETRALVREAVAQSLADYTPETLAAQWRQTEAGGPLASPQPTVTLRGGELVVGSVQVMPPEDWQPREARNWPDKDGAWLSRFAPESSDYFVAAPAEEKVTPEAVPEIGNLSAPATPALPGGRAAVAARGE